MLVASLEAECMAYGVVRKLGLIAVYIWRMSRSLQVSDVAQCQLVLFFALAVSSPHTRCISASKYHQAVTRGAALLSSSQYSLPKGSGNLTLRSTAIAVKQATFLYGPAVDGAGPPSPSGALGISYIATDSTLVDGELAQQVLVSTNDSLVAKSDSAQV